jgi:hypothetical protein
MIRSRLIESADLITGDFFNLADEWAALRGISSIRHYRVGMFIGAKPTSNEILQSHVFTDDVQFPINFAGSAINIGINPTASFTLSIFKNTTVIGTIGISSAGLVTWSMVTSTTFVTGDLMIIKAPAVADTTLSNVSVTLKGLEV